MPSGAAWVRMPEAEPYSSVPASSRPRSPRARRSCGLHDRVVLTGLVPRDDVFVAVRRRRRVRVDVARGGLAGGGPGGDGGRVPRRSSRRSHHTASSRTARTSSRSSSPETSRGSPRRSVRYREMSPEERREIGRRCRSHMAARFTLPIMRAATEAVYREVAPRSAAWRAPR